MSDKDSQKPSPPKDDKGDKGWRDAERKRIDRGDEGRTQIEKMWRPDPWPDPPPPPREKDREKE